MFIAPFKAIRAQPHKMKLWIKRQIGDSLHQNIVEKISAYKPPKNAFEFSMYVGGSWFGLTSNRDRSLTPILSRIPTNIIYEDIAKPLLNIQNLQKDKRISYIHYEHTEQKIKDFIKLKML